MHPVVVSPKSEGGCARVDPVCSTRSDVAPLIYSDEEALDILEKKVRYHIEGRQVFLVGEELGVGLFGWTWTWTWLA